MGEINRKFKLNADISQKQSVICKSCSRETLHVVVASYDESGSENCGNGFSIDWHRENQIIQCLGCETVSFRSISTNSEDVEYDHEGSHAIETVKYYPSRSEGLKSLQSYLLPITVQKIYEETVLAIENEQFVLAGIGIRAIVETVCKDLDAEGKDLYQKIDSLKGKSIVTAEGAVALHKLRVLGNAAAHEVKEHGSEQLKLGMQVIEHMLEGTYIIPERVKKVFPENG